MTPETVTVVVCTYNRAASLRRALDSLVVQETGGAFLYEILVVDDGSTDDTHAVVQEAAAAAGVPVRYVREECGRGVAGARNRGIAEADSDWIAFCDDDQLAAKDWLENLLAAASQTGASCVGGPIGLDLPAGQEAQLGPVCRTILGEHVFADEPIVFRGRELPSSGNLLVARRVFETVERFDTTLSSGEDADLLVRVRDAGYEIRNAPKAMMYHTVLPHRLEAAYFRWVSRRWGVNFARIDYKARGPLVTWILAKVRIAQALLVNMPLLLLARLRGDRAAALDRRCLVWRAEGYVRKAVQLIAPRLFPQRDFLEQLAFRKEREVFAPESESTERETGSS